MLSMLAGAWSPGPVRRAPSKADLVSKLSERASDSPAVNRLAEMPLRFAPNHGQAAEAVEFIAHPPGYDLLITRNEAIVSFRDPQKEALSMRLVDSNPSARVRGVDELAGKTNYIRGNAPSRWVTDVPAFRSVILEEAYPGIDVVYYGNETGLEYDLKIEPWADPSRVTLRFEGSERVEIDGQGKLVITTRGDERVTHHSPIAFQEKGGQAWPVKAEFEIRNASEVGFRVEEYDRAAPLTIDPVVTYSTYLGGGVLDEVLDVAVDGAGNVYVCGLTFSADFPTRSAFQSTPKPNLEGMPTADVFVTKLSPSGESVVYSTFVAGSMFDQGASIAVDASGSAVVAGYTTSTDFPTQSAFQSQLAGEEDAFVFKLNPTGNALIYSTYIGGSINDRGNAVALDQTGNAYLTGVTGSADFPTRNALFPGCDCLARTDAFVTKLNPSGSALVYSTYLGGGGTIRGGTDVATGIAVDQSGNAYVCGSTSSSNFPTVNAIQPSFNDDLSQGFELTDGFITKLNSAGTALLFSTYLGGTGVDEVSAIALDSTGSVYVTGLLSSTNFPATAGASQTASTGLGSGPGLYVAKASTDGQNLLYSTFIDAGGFVVARGIAVDSEGNAHVTGNTNSSTFPIVNPVQPLIGGPLGDAFVFKLNASGTALKYSTFFGGLGKDTGNAVAVDSSGNAYVAGTTASVDLPVAASMQSQYGGDPQDGFVLKIADPDRNPALITIGEYGDLGVRSDRPVPISFTVNDPDGLVGIIVSISLDSGRTFNDVARVPAGTNEVIWNAPDPMIANAQLRITAVDALGNATFAFGKRFLLSPSFADLPTTMKVTLSFDPPPPGLLAPPANVRAEAVEVPPNSLPRLGTILNPGGPVPDVAGFNVYRVARPAPGQPVPGAAEITRPENLVGSVASGSSSFVNFVGTNRGDNFLYSVVTVSASGAASEGSAPVGSDLPVIKNPVFRNKALFFDAAGSFVAPEGATLIVSGRETFPLKLDGAGTLFSVTKKARSTPGDKPIKKVLRAGGRFGLTVKNPDGKTSLTVFFER
jgi:hypothetical protein